MKKMTITVLDHDNHKGLETFDFEMPFEFTLETAGDGLWSNKVRKVKTTKLQLDTMQDGDHRWGELRVFFDTDTWDPSELGLIYTDKGFMDDLRGCLDVVGLCDHDVDYSEQGMQGDDYVSCDVGEQFIASWEFKLWEESELVGA